MNDYRVLFYPGFSPDPVWARKILLLCDGITRIVPNDVRLDDPADLLRLQSTLDGCIASVAPERADVALQPSDADLLNRAFRILSQKERGRPRRIEIEISTDGTLSIQGHVFVHDTKMSDEVQAQLRRHGLMIAGFDNVTEGFIVVKKEASDIILAGLASRMARRLGLDAVTDRGMPFAFGTLRGMPRQDANDGTAEGAVLTAIASVMIPTNVAHLTPTSYRELRNSFGEVREAFKVLTEELARVHRLNRVTDPHEFATRVTSIANEFGVEYRKYRRSRYARRFKSWAPLVFGGALSVAASVTSPFIAAGLVTGSLAVQMLDKYRASGASINNERVFHMLTGIRRDIIRRSGLYELMNPLGSMD